MKKIKTLCVLIILIFLGLLIYQNVDYFFNKTGLSLNLGLESWNWTFPAIQNIGYLGICFLIGLVLTGIKWLGLKMKTNKKIKKLNSDIESYLEQISSLKTELEKFKNDPYRKDVIDNQAAGSEQFSDTEKEETTAE